MTILQNSRFLSSLSSHMTFKTILLFMILMEVKICAIISSVPIKDFYPTEIEASKLSINIQDTRVLQLGYVTDQDTTSAFGYIYTVSLARVQTLGAYMIAVGLKGMDVYFPVQPTSGLAVGLSYQNPTPTQYDVQLQISGQNQWNYVRVSNIAISKSIGKVYNFFKSCAINGALTPPTTMDFTYTDAAIQPITGSYFMFISIFKFDPIFQLSAVTNRELKVTMYQNTTTLYTIRVASQGFDIGTLGVQGFLIDSSLINNPKLRNVIMITDVVYGSTASQEIAYVVQYPGVYFWFEHAFFGLYHIQEVDKPNYDFFVYSTGKIQIHKEANMIKVGAYVLVFYNNKCVDPTVLDPQTGNCILCPDRCLSCNSTECFSCANGFTPSADKKSCECAFPTVVSDICADFNSGPLKGCVLATKNATQVLCMACSMPEILVAKNYECSCKDGYEFDSNGKCQEVCGDNLRENMECDDGNLVDGDGCDSSCNLQPGFDCTVTLTSTVCKSELYLFFGVISIMKNQDNSAVLKFGVSQNQIPYPLKMQDFSPLTLLQKRYSIKVQLQDGSIQQLQCQLTSIQNNQLSFHVDYNFTIEGSNAFLYLDMSGTKYTMKEINYSFKAKGSNEPLKFSGNLNLFLGAEKGYMGLSCVYILLLLIGLIAPKYIGLEAMLTLQLIYYSTLLVRDAERYPVGFDSFAILQLSTGYNDFFGYMTLILKSDLTAKLNFINIKKLIIQNYNSSFVLLFLSGLIFGISWVVRRYQQNNLLQKTDEKKNMDKIQSKMIREKFERSLKINEILFRAYNQISVWSILQIISAISAQIMVSSTFFILNQKIPLISLGSIVWFIAGILVFTAGFTQFRNILLSPITIGKLQERPSQLTYRKVNFIYVIVVGVIIFFFNEKTWWEIYPSVIVTFVHVIYMVVLWMIHPYQKSLHVHTVALVFNQIIYLLFLVFVNMINYIDVISEIISLAFVFFILILCVIVILFTAVRLYYEYRYGQKLEIEIQKQREEAQRLQKLEQERILNQKRKTFEEEAKQRLNEQLKKRIQNKYIYENQIIEAQMNDFIQFWEKRPNLKQQLKQSEYFQKYCRKPMSWLKSNDLEEYTKRLIELEKAQQFERQRINSKYEDPEYHKVSVRLKKQFVKKQKKERFQKINQKKRKN